MHFRTGQLSHFLKLVQFNLPSCGLPKFSWSVPWTWGPSMYYVLPWLNLFSSQQPREKRWRGHQKETRKGPESLGKCRGNRAPLGVCQGLAWVLPYDLLLGSKLLVPRSYFMG